MNCPCLIADKPCHESCSCVTPFLSSGCYCCASYGSQEQQKLAANRIVKACSTTLNESFADGFEQCQRMASDYIREQGMFSIRKQMSFYADTILSLKPNIEQSTVKYWPCEHIQRPKDTHFDWEFRYIYRGGVPTYSAVPDDWQECPICLASRPK